MPSAYPWMQWFTEDWLADTAALSAAAKGVWANACFVMHQQGRCGRLVGTIEQLAKRVHCTADEVRLALPELETPIPPDYTHGVATIERDVNGMLTLINRRQDSDHKERERIRLAAKDSMQKKRVNGVLTEKQRDVNGMLTAHNHNHNHNHIQKDSTEKPAALSAEPTLTAAMQELVDAWNLTGFSKFKSSSPKRRRAMIARLKEPFFAANWREALRRIEASDFCRGKSQTGWTATFDFFIRPETAIKAMEGNYDNRQSAFNDRPDRNAGTLNALLTPDDIAAANSKVR